MYHYDCWSFAFSLDWPMLFLAALLNLFFTLASGSLGKNSVPLLTWTPHILLWGGRFNLCIGLGVWFVKGLYGYAFVQPMVDRC